MSEVAKGAPAGASGASELAPMEAEFDTVAAWTERVVRDLGPEYAIPAACRGSGSASWLRWIASGMTVRETDRFLDAGAGLGGPAAWLRQEVGVAPVLAEPMVGACQGAARLFGMPTAAAWSQALPFRDAAFDAAWLLGVLCTVDDKLGLLRELHRVLVPGGRLGLLVLVQVADELSTQPEGNAFPTPRSLPADLESAGFRVTAQTSTGELAPPDDDWNERTAVVERALEERYASRPAWQLAAEQEKRMARLLHGGDIQTWLLCAEATGS